MRSPGWKRLPSSFSDLLRCASMPRLCDYPPRTTNGARARLIGVLALAAIVPRMAAAELRELWRATPWYSVESLAFTPAGLQLASGGWAASRAGAWFENGPALALGEIQLQDVRTGTWIRRFAGATGGTTALAFTPDGRRLVTGRTYTEKDAIVWDVDAGRQIGALEGHTEAV